jgi:hypothetical protein
MQSDEAITFYMPKNKGNGLNVQAIKNYSSIIFLSIHAALFYI